MRIIYLLPTHNNKPSGGIKVIYQHAEILNTMGIDASVLHLYKPSFYCTWFESNAIKNKSAVFNVSDDFLVIPEVLAGDIGSFCLKNNLKYGIFVQNGYLIQKGKNKKTNSEIFEIYNRAETILVISEETKKAVKFIFSSYETKKIIKIRPYIKDLSNSLKKSFLISFMSRKLNDHSKNISFLLKNKISKNWKLIDINDYSEEQTTQILNRSRVFLSFSNQEGLGLPPIEAALCNNYVIGYTGRGGDEYFKLPLFNKVEYGDIFKFINKIKFTCQMIENDLNAFKKEDVNIQKNNLLSFYSSFEVEKDLANFYNLLKLIKFPKDKTKIKFSSNLILNFFYN